MKSVAISPRMSAARSTSARTWSRRDASSRTSRSASRFPARSAAPSPGTSASMFPSRNAAKLKKPSASPFPARSAKRLRSRDPAKFVFLLPECPSGLKKSGDLEQWVFWYLLTLLIVQFYRHSNRYYYIYGWVKLKVIRCFKHKNWDLIVFTVLYLYVK